LGTRPGDCRRRLTRFWSHFARARVMATSFRPSQAFLWAQFFGMSADLAGLACSGRHSECETLETIVELLRVAERGDEDDEGESDLVTGGG
jgi:hypothetical protein